MNFVAFDVETANQADASICAIGLAVFEDDKLTGAKYWLVRPPKGYGFFRPDWTNDVHGIKHTDVYGKPEFPTIAPEIFARLAAADVVVAHNASFDMRKLRATAGHFGLEIPPFDYLCTLALARSCWPKPLLPNHELATLAAHIGHKFEHHHALADAEAAGRIVLAMMRQTGVAGPRELEEKAGLPTVLLKVRALLK